MKKILKKIIVSLILSITIAFVLHPSQLMAQAPAGITNPAIDPSLGTGVNESMSGTTFQKIFILIWRSIIMAGGLILLIIFIWASIDWISAGGDSAKVQKARDKMTQAVVGLVILVGSFVIIAFISQLFFGDSFDPLKFVIPHPTN